jgi:adenylosuccinate lyase
MKSSYNSTLSSRYASREMLYIWSDSNKYSLWRKLWFELAKLEKKWGASISDEGLVQMEANLFNISWDRVDYWEGVTRHEVLAHIHAFGEQAPEAKSFIHLGATSCDIMDNAELILIRDSLNIILKKAAGVLNNLSNLSLEWKSEPILGYTHFQPAQLTTIGKRIALWLSDFYQDFVSIDREISSLKFRGLKGAVGTSATFYSLFGENFPSLEKEFAKAFGFQSCYPIMGQTYSRKIEHQILNSLSGLASSSCKMATDLRLLCHTGEMEEPFESGQVGSSAMPYKRNPMRSERVCSLSRHLASLTGEGLQTAMSQWLERSLDDSAARRLYLPESFLVADSILQLLLNISSGLVINRGAIKRKIREQLPYLASEEIILAMVEKGFDRQKIHEELRELFMNNHKQKEAGTVEGGEDLISILLSHPAFSLIEDSLRSKILNEDNVSYLCGMAEEQAQSFSQFVLSEISKTDFVNHAEIKK